MIDFCICAVTYVQAALNNEKSEKSFTADVAEFDLVMQVSSISACFYVPHFVVKIRFT